MSNILPIIALFSLIFLIGCQADKQPEKQLIFADSAQPAFTLVYLADALGYFQAENLKVVFDKRYTSGLNSLKAALQGNADIAGVFTTPIIYQALDGNAVKMISTLYASPKTIGIVASRKSGIEKPEDLIGKKLAVTLSTGGEFFLHLFLASIEADLSQIRVFGVEPEAMTDFLASGKVDAIITWQPYINNAETRLTPEKAITFYSSIYMNIAVLATTNQVLEHKHEELVLFLKALKQAEIYLNQNEAQAAQIVLPYFAQTSALSPLDNPSWQSQYFRMGISNVLLATLEMQSIWILNNGLKTGAIPDFSHYLAPEPLLKAYPETVTVY